MKNASVASDLGEGYISSIDGLRAIAVLLVLFFHVGFELLSGGFIGVDVFFVISGFLITKNILKQLDDGTFTFGQFYGRRIARLFPALLVVLMISLITGYFVLSPLDLKNAGQAGLYSSVSTSNFFFWFESGYFDTASETKLFLHTWSLSVEEQFYLVWPGLLMFLYFVWKRKGIFLGLVLLSGLSLAFAVQQYQEYPNTVFYLMPFRVYQFGLGGMLAMLPLIRFENFRGLLSCLSSLGLLAIGHLVEGQDAWYMSLFCQHFSLLCLFSALPALFRTWCSLINYLFGLVSDLIQST